MAPPVSREKFVSLSGSRRPHRRLESKNPDAAHPADTVRPFLPLLLLCVFLSASTQAHPQTLYSQSLQTALTRQNPNTEFLLYDLPSQTTLANTFPDPTRPIPPGSLVKPFLALAYATHHPTLPTITCHGHSDLCWSATGHGPLTLPQAIAQSCNAYFLALAKILIAGCPIHRASCDEWGLSTRIPNLPPPPPNPTPETLIGLTPAWLISPDDLVHAYATLLASPPSPTRTAILLGMRASATERNRHPHRPPPRRRPNQNRHRPLPQLRSGPALQSHRRRPHPRRRPRRQPHASPAGPPARHHRSHDRPRRRPHPHPARGPPCLLAAKRRSPSYLPREGPSS